MAMGLIKDDREIEFIFEEAVTVMLPNQLRKFFARFLLTKKIETKKIWDKHRAFLEKILKITMNRALLHIQNILSQDNRYCREFGLPEPFEIDERMLNKKELIMHSKQIFDSTYPKLNESQKKGFEEIISEKQNFYFIDGPGGSGKTFLKNINTLLHNERKEYYFYGLDWNSV